MEKLRRSERIIIMAKTLADQPHTLFSLGYFADLFQAAKSTISEDLGILRDIFSGFNFGQVETFPGATGGVKYTPRLDHEYINQFLQGLCTKLATPDRVVPGGFIYMNDVIFEPSVVSKLGEIFATKFAELRPDYIVTVETKGIPLALMTAKAFNVPLIIIRDNSKVTEGSAVSINYVSGSTRRIHTMSLSRRALPEGANVLIIDDFMKAGGTARGMMDLMAEFQANVLGVGVLISTDEPGQKLVNEYVALLDLQSINESTKEIHIRPGKCFHN